jgi:hypothetical protein
LAAGWLLKLGGGAQACIVPLAGDGGTGGGASNEQGCVPPTQRSPAAYAHTARRFQPT